VTVYAFSRLPAFNPNTNPASVAKSATGSVYDLGDTGFLTPLNLTLVATNTVTTTLISDANGMFPDFTLVDRTQCAFKSGTQVFILTTTTPIPGPIGAASTVPGPPGPATTDASLLTAGTVADARLPTRLGDAALSSTYGRKQGAMEFSDDYSAKANGAPPAALTGQAYSLYSATNPNGIPTISGGYLTYADTDYLGGYSTIPLENGCVKLGASFALTAWTVGGGLAAIAAMEEDIKVTQAAGQGVPRSPFHLTIAPDSWGLSVFITKGGSPTTVISGLFTPNLVADGTTLHRVEGVIDTVNQKVYLTLPNGERHTASHPAMGVAAPFVFVEPYRDTNVAGKTKAKFRNFWADSRNAQPLAEAKALAKIPAGPIAVENMPGVQSDMVLNTTASAVAGVSASYIVPDSGTVIVTVEGLLDQTAAGPVYFGMFDESNALVAVRTVSTKITNGRFSLRMPLTTGTPGQAKTAKMCAYLGGTAAATLLLGNYGTPAIYAGASIMVTPT